MKSVFTAKLGSGYDDVVEERYHFPSTYLNQVERSVGDSIIYYEPRRKLDTSGGRQAYFAVARVVGIERDASREGHYYALMSDYLDFDQAVPFRQSDGYFEAILERADGETNRGAFGRSVRGLSEQEFDRILRSAFSTEVSPSEPAAAAGFEEPQSEFKRPLIEVTETRWFRDRAFARHVQQAYGKTCAITGLQIINGGGRAEVQAAHIQPVAEAGSDSIRNGLALSGTVHWMFDRGLIAIDTDYRIRFAGTGVPEPIQRLVNPTGKILLPNDARARPHPHYLEYHMQNIFKG
jgi:putative restriction endonuclease